MCMAGVVSNEPNYLLVNFLSVQFFFRKEIPSTILQITQEKHAVD